MLSFGKRKIRVKKRTKIILWSMAAVFLLLLLGMSYFIGSQVFQASTQLATNEDTKGVSESFWEKCGIDYESFKKEYQIEALELESSFDGHTIPADYIYAKGMENNKDNQTVILVHGLGGNRYSNYPLAEFFLEEGYNIITYDQRSSNENTARYTTFGYWEKYDLADYIKYVKKHVSDKPVGVWGTSFGGATAGLALGESDVDHQIDFMILDCPVSSMEWMIEQEMIKMDTGLPVSYMVWCGNVMNRIKLGFTYGDADVSKAVRHAETPVLVINSKKDTLTPYFMGKDIYDGLQGKTGEIWTVGDSEHAEIWFDHNDDYRRTVKEFINGQGEERDE